MAASSGIESNNGASSSREAEPETPQIPPFRMPTMEEIRAQEVWNNCAVRSVASGVMGETMVLSFWDFVSHFGFIF